MRTVATQIQHLLMLCGKKRNISPKEKKKRKNRKFRVAFHQKQKETAKACAGAL